MKSKFKSDRNKELPEDDPRGQSSNHDDDDDKERPSPPLSSIDYGSDFEGSSAANSGPSYIADEDGKINGSENPELNNEFVENDNISGDECSDLHHGVEESDFSEDEVAPRNTVGDVPLEWYKDEEHIGYDLVGKRISKKVRQDKLDSFLASSDGSKSWLIRKLLKGQAPHAEFYPNARDDAIHPLSNAPEQKRRFIPSKWERKVVELARAIRKGPIKFEKPKEEPRFYHVWADDSSAADKTSHLAYIPAPKPNVPGHEESYNPSLEYIPIKEEINSYLLMYDEDSPKFKDLHPCERNNSCMMKTALSSFARGKCH